MNPSPLEPHSLRLFPAAANDRRQLSIDGCFRTEEIDNGRKWTTAELSAIFAIHRPCEGNALVATPLLMPLYDDARPNPKLHGGEEEEEEEEEKAHVLPDDDDDGRKAIKEGRREGGREPAGADSGSGGAT